MGCATGCSSTGSRGDPALSDALLVSLVAVAMAVGVVGTVVPAVPGLALVWAAALVYGLSAGFGVAGTVAFTAISILAIAGGVVGWVVPQRAAARGGAGPWSMWLGAVLGVVGFFVVPVVGVALGGVVGVFLGEAVRTRDATAAWRATIETLKGFGVAGAAQVLVGIAMVAVWIAWVVVGS